MSQHDFTIDNQTFPVTRSDINSALQALASLSSGASSPSTTFAYQLWVDTTSDPNILNVRNSANNAWIKIGEVNQGSAAFILTAYAILQAGSAAAPSHSFDTDRDTGMYRAAANIIGFATNGTERVRINDSGQAEFSSGTAALPSITTIGDVNTGVFFPAADTIAFVEGGAEAMRINSSGQAEFTAGTAALPALTTTGDTNTGVFYPAADTVGIVTGGTERVRVNASGQAEFTAGTAALPSITATGDTNTGIFFPAADTIAFAEGGAEAMRIDSSGIVTGTAGNLMLIIGTSVSISGSPTSVAFTGLPSWVKRIVIQLQDVSTNGTSNYIVQLGYGGTPTYVATGYDGSCNTQAGTGVQNSTGFTIANSVTAANTWSGHIILTNITGNVWVESSNVGASDATSNRYSSGNNDSTALLTAVRITTVIGTQTFDTGGVVNISYE